VIRKREEAKLATGFGRVSGKAIIRDQFIRVMTVIIAELVAGLDVAVRIELHGLVLVV
jgi:hypothetical protein